MTVQTVDELDTLLATVDDAVLAEFGQRVQERLEWRRAPRVSKVDLFLTQRCNLRCTYCFLDGSEREGDMATEVAERALRLVLKLSRDSKEIDLSTFGGEPLLVLDKIEEILEIATRLCREHDKVLRVGCTTNGTLLDERALAIAQKYQFGYLLSVDGLPALHDRYRKTMGGQGTFAQVAEKIPLLKAHQGWVGARMTVMPEGIDRLAEGVRYLYELGVNQFIIGPVMEAEWTPEQIAEIKPQYYALLKMQTRLAAEQAPFRLSLLERPVSKPGKLQHWGCGAGMHSLAVDAQGNVYPCARMLRRTQYCMGQVSQGALNWRVGEYVSDQRPEVRLKCASCDYRNDCTGGCFESNWAATGSPYYPPEAQCAETKALVELRQEHPEFMGFAESPASEARG